ncbi:MAG: ATP-binding cassette domain-containing protein [Campylobacteraceae bacterium]|jgi:molybdate transport system ATP-binding protein|nr:ATP-binding cassette domain-containing protein [Campylobacteraceae bacterium]
MININIRKSLHGSGGSMDLRVNVSLESGSFTALTGQSGSGKTTFLRILSGLEQADGEIITDGEIWQNEKFILPPQKRGIGFVFQDYALFPNMSVEENLLFVNKDIKLAKHLLEITELGEFKKRAANTLSGGQKQRVALARALMNRPKLLLLDEPLSALDPAIRAKLQSEIAALHKEFATTTVLVSHDPSEIYKLASKMIVLKNGAVMDIGAPSKLLLKTSGSQKFSFEGELLDIKKIDAIYVAVIAIGRQIVEVVADESELDRIKIGAKVAVSVKAFTPNINPA